jgi:hypothetical protein
LSRTERTFADWDRSAHVHATGAVYAVFTGAWTAIFHIAYALPTAVVLAVALQVITGLYGCARAVWKAAR